jgi:hypothetical protein
MLRKEEALSIAGIHRGNNGKEHQYFAHLMSIYARLCTVHPSVCGKCFSFHLLTYIFFVWIL